MHKTANISSQVKCSPSFRETLVIAWIIFKKESSLRMFFFRKKRKKKKKNLAETLPSAWKIFLS